ncbi:MAG: TonB-dependent receptor [Rhodanobacteraceae bacterium]|nr:TonB-dependent receptor [Rhodanobacteraceae bacterium]
MRRPLFLSIFAAITGLPLHAADPTAAAASADDKTWTMIDAIEVQGEETPYAASKAPSVTRSEVPLLQQARSVAVINRAIIDEQQLTTLSDVLENVAGAVPIRENEMVLVNPIIRGFDAEVFVDGLSAYGATSVADPSSLVNVERVEVLKGPGGTLFGSGFGSALGGLINVVTKSPEEAFMGTVGLRIGSFDTSNPYFDVNLPVSENVGLRVNGEYGDTDSAIDNAVQRKASLNPSFLLRMGDATRLLLKAQLTRNENLEYSGLPASITVNGDFGVDPFRFSGSTDAPLTQVDNRIYTGSLEHLFSDSLMLTVDARGYDSRFVEYGTFFFGGPDDPAQPTVYTLLSAQLPTDVRQYTLAPRLNWQIDQGDNQHDLVIGADFDKTDYFAQIGFNFAGIGQIDYRNRTGAPPFGAVPPLGVTQDDRFRTSAVYIEDHLRIGDRWTLQAGLRGTRLHFRQPSSGTDETYTEITPRLGASLLLNQRVSLFAGYSEGFRGVSNFFGLAAQVPETSRQYEAGVKFAAAGGLSGSIAAFRLDRRNVVISAGDLGNPFLQSQSGEQRSQGLDVDLVYEPGPQWSALLAYAYTDTEVTRDEPLRQGNAFSRVPRHSVRGAVRYRIVDGPLSGLALGLGARAVSSRELTLPNLDQVPGVTVFDAQASYTWGDAEFMLSLVNLADKRYFEPYQYLAQSVVIPGDRRSAYLSVAYRF